MITLGGVALNPSMLWVDRFNYPIAAQSVQRTLGGNVVISGRVYSSGGRPITMEANQDTGWLTGAALDALYTQAVTPEGIFVFNFFGVTYNVMYRHTDGIAIDFKPIIPSNSLHADVLYVGTLRLITV